MVTTKPFLATAKIQEKVKELGARISADYEGKNLVVVPILKGAFMFASDLVRAISIPLSVDFVMASSYEHTDSTGEVKLHCDLRDSIKGRDILLVEDIVDTGLTLNYIRETFMQREPASIKICGLLNKQERRVVDIKIDYTGFDIPNLFVVGYGLDYENRYRNLPYIAIFKKST